MPGYQAGVPQQTRDTPSQPNMMPGYQQAGVPQQTRDRPSQPNMMPGYQQAGVPQQTRDTPSQPNVAPYPQPGAAPYAQPGYQQPQGYAAAPPSGASPDTTLRTRPNAGDSSLDKPPKNMLPIYALIGVVVVAAVIVLIVLLK